MLGIAGWSSGNQSAGPNGLAIWARVNDNFDPGRFSCVVLSSTAGGAGTAGGVPGGGGVAKAQAQGGGASSAQRAEAAPAKTKAAAAANAFIAFLPFLVAFGASERRARPHNLIQFGLAHRCIFGAVWQVLCAIRLSCRT